MDHSNSQSPEQFYGILSGKYDEMTRFHERLESEKEIMQKWRDKYGFESVLDVACGTGLHSLILKQLGVKVVGTDISAKMLRKARENSKNTGLTIDFIESPMHELTTTISDKFDMIFCLGNSIPHILEKSVLQKSFLGFRDLLSDGGRLVIQLLNYEKILKRRNRIISIKRHNQSEFIRFLDFQEGMVVFNVLEISWNGDKPGHQLISTPMVPYHLQELTSFLKNAGFCIEAIYGNMRFESFDAEKSDNLVLVCKNS
jgi:SAM-dependent methyltransferase